MGSEKKTVSGNSPDPGFALEKLGSAGGVATLYFLITLVCVHSSSGLLKMAVFWPANGFLLAMLIRGQGIRRWPTLVLCMAGCVVANRLDSKPFLPAYGFAFANMVEVLFAEFLVRKLRIGPGILTDIPKTFLFLGPVAVAAATASAVLAAGLLSAFSGASFLDTALAWWSVDAVGLAVVTPAVLSWFGPDLAWEKNRHRKVEILLCAMGALGLTATLFLYSKALWGPFGNAQPQSVFPFLLWAALRFGARGAVTLNLAVYGLSGWFTSRDFGPFAELHDSPVAALGSLLVFHLVIAICTLIPAVLINSHLALLERLRARDYRYNKLWASKLVGIYVADPAGTILEANETFLGMVGYSRHELETGDVQMPKLSTPEYLDQAKATGELFHNEGQVGPFEREWALRDGGRFRSVVFATKLESDRAMGMVLDINELKQTQQELRRSEDLFASLMDSDIIGVAVLDSKAVFEAANAAYLSIIGYEQRDVAEGRLKASMLFVEGTEEQYRQMGETLEAHGRIDSIEGKYRHKNGADIPVYRGITRLKESGRYLVVAMELTRMKEVQSALHRSELLFRSLAEASLVGTIRLDTRGECTYANPKWLSMAGITERDLKSRGWRHAIHESDRADVNAAWDIFLSGGPPVIRDYRLRKPNGTLTWVSAWSTELQDEDGSRIGFLEKTIDITEHMRAKAELESAIKSAEDANQAKSQFLAHMSHEIRTPMNGVLGTLSLLVGTPLNPEQRKYAEVAKQSGEHLLSLIDQVLDFSKIEGLHLRLDETGFDISDVLEGTLATVAGVAAKKGLKVVAEKDVQLAERFIGDPVRLRQILLNLAGNAVKFSERGEVRISVRTLAETADATQLLFEVSDEGPGISPEAARTLFQPFRQGDTSLSRKAGGTGLGLAISKDLVALMGGKIWVESRPRSGSSFRFTVLLRKPSGVGNIKVTQSNPSDPSIQPDFARAEDKVSLAVPRDRPEGSRPESGTADPINGNPRILLVDDHPTNLLVASAMLGKMGCTVDTVMDGEAALNAIRDEPYDLILMDCQMPELDGFQTTARIRGLSAPMNRVPIIALTAHAVAGVRERCLSAGMDDYISKPFAPERLRDVLRDWIGFRTAWKDKTARTGLPASNDSLKGDMDWSRLDSLEDGSPEGRRSVQALVELFLETSGSDLRALQRHITEARSGDMSRILHRLKGACGTLGALALTRMAADMETCAASGDQVPLQGMLERLETELSRTGGLLRSRLGSQ